MSTSLKVIALISGGKDSLFSILHCLANGHEVIALANLHPPLQRDGKEGEDINSYMYQTVGHSIIPHFSEALGLPLYRQEIQGGAVSKDRDYANPSSSDAATDETESLIPLLKKVKEAHPEANAISTGAILSTYQRTRVESIALRLGLTPLSYLWQYPYLPPYSQSQLLNDMAAVGQDSRIIKVASGGMDSSFIWLDVAAPKTIMRLQKAVARFGENGDGAVLGEGGEFETLAIDGPSVLWKRRIEVAGVEDVEGEGGNAVARWTGTRTTEKGIVEGEEKGLADLRIPDMWDSTFNEIAESLAASTIQLSSKAFAHDQPLKTQEISLSSAQWPTNTMFSSSYSTLTISNLISLEPASTPAAQLDSILRRLTTTLEQFKLPFSSITHTTLLLRRISDFTTLNPIYSCPFTSPNPPSRVTVACGDEMPEGIDVMMSVIVSKKQQRRGLHVQSRSYWAPANIGPYSQAITTPLLPPGPHEMEGVGIWNGEGPQAVYIAGQIPLVPASMSTIEGPFEMQAVLALQHLWRIGRAMNVQWWTAGVAYISGCNEEEGQERARMAIQAWDAVHHNHRSFSHEVDEDEDEEADIDPWDRQYGLAGGSVFNDKTALQPLPDWAVAKEAQEQPPAFVVQVSELPRNVDVEWVSTGLAKTTDIHTRNLVVEERVVHITRTGKTAFIAVPIRRTTSPATVKNAVWEETGLEAVWEHATLYATGKVSIEWSGMEGLQWIPITKAWSTEGEICGVLTGRLTVGVGEHGQS